MLIVRALFISLSEFSELGVAWTTLIGSTGLFSLGIPVAQFHVLIIISQTAK
ncbi:hypothetical protein TorRG33x02_334050, partial [Trema orientale]